MGMRSEELEIACGDEQKCLSMYPLARPIKESLEWIDDEGEEDEDLEGYRLLSSHWDDVNTVELMVFYYLVLSTFMPWFANIRNFLVVGVLPQHFTKGQKATLIWKSIFYTWQHDCLYSIGPNSILRCCIKEDKVLDILKAYHSKPGGGHYGGQHTAMKILNAGYY